MRIVFKYLKPYIFPIIFSVTFLLGQVFTELTLPNLMSEIVDKGILLQGIDPKDQMSVIYNLGLKMLGVSLLSVFCSIGVSFLATRIAAGVSRNMRRDLFKKVNDFASSEIDKFSTASLITRNTNDVQQIQNFVTMGLRMMLFAPFMGIGSVVMALSKSHSLAWVIVVAILVIIGLLIVLLIVALPKFKIMQSLVDRLNLVSREDLSGMLVIRAFSNEGYEEERFDVANKDLTFTTRFVQRALAFMLPGVQIVMTFTQVALIWFGAKLVGASSLAIGDMLAFLQYAVHIMISFLFVSVIFIILPRAQVSANRIREVLETEISIRDKENAEVLSDVKGTVEFKNVSFCYADDSEKVLDNISFKAEPGKTTAFIGATGSGKTTLINLIPRFYDVTEGEILIDGHDVRDVTLESLRDSIGYVPQKPFLFSGTIESNVKYANSDADVDFALKIAQAKEIVDAKAEGVHSPIAQGAANVSGGQKQRLSVARAIAKNAPIYIFDDSFSALDFKTDSALRHALAENITATILIVAQRVSTIMNADQIVVLSEGKIVGLGTHEELLEKCAAYREICESQLSKEELA